MCSIDQPVPPHFTETEGPLPSLQQPATAPFPESAEFSKNLHILFSLRCTLISFYLPLGLLRGLFSSGFPTISTE